jgi:hypothetical protein
MTFELEAVATSISKAAVAPNWTESDGTERAAAAYYLYLHPPGVYTDIIAMFHNTTGNIGFYSKINSTVGTGTAGLSSKDKKQFVRIDITWINGTIYTYVDEYLYNTSVQGAFHASLFQDIRVGGGEGVASLGDYYIRNLQISNRPLMFPTHPYLNNVVGFGDSYINQGSEIVQVYRYDQRWAIELRKILNHHGLNMNYTNKGWGGYSINAGATFTLDDKYAEVVALEPSYVIYWAGTNDALGGGVPDVATDLAVQLDAIKALDTVQKIIVLNVVGFRSLSTYDSDTYATYVDSVNADIAAYVAADVTGKIELIDMFTAWGGHYQTPGYLIGTTEPGSLDIHKSGHGHWDAAQRIANVLLSTLG